MNAKVPCLLASLVLSFGIRAASATDRTFDRTLSTGSAPSISVSTASGYIHLSPGSDNQVHVSAHLHSGNGWFGGGGASADFEQIIRDPPIRQEGNDIIVGERHSSDLYRNITIDYEITAPRDSALDLVSGSGDLEIQNVGSTLKAQSGSGAVRARGVHGPATLGSGSGDLELFETARGDVRAQTGSGSIRLHDISGGLRAGTGSGDVEIFGSVTSDWKIDTGSGSIRLNLGSQAHFELDAFTGSGNVRVGPPVSLTGDTERHHVSGKVNGGGPLLKAQTGSGDIEIH